MQVVVVVVVVESSAGKVARLTICKNIFSPLFTLSHRKPFILAPCWTSCLVELSTSFFSDGGNMKINTKWWQRAHLKCCMFHKWFTEKKNKHRKGGSWRQYFHTWYILNMNTLLNIKMPPLSQTGLRDFLALNHKDQQKCSCRFPMMNSLQVNTPLNIAVVKMLRIVCNVNPGVVESIGKWYLQNCSTQWEQRCDI